MSKRQARKWRTGLRPRHVSVWEGLQMQRVTDCVLDAVVALLATEG